MDSKDKNIIISRYQNRLKEHGSGVKALSSGTPERQKLRFSHMSEIGDLQGKSILDFGCGLGDFYKYLSDDLGLSVAYTGVDIVSDFIKISKTTFPKAEWVCDDILSSDFLKSRKFDYIFCSQVFNNKYENTDNLNFVKKASETLFQAAKEGLCMDFLTSYVDFEEPHLHYYSPEELYSHVKSFTKRVVLKSDYPLYEFMLFCYPDFKGWSKSKN